MNISRTEGSGNITLYFVLSGNNEVIPQPEGLYSGHRTETIVLNHFNILTLNYSSGADIELIIEKRNYADNWDTYTYQFSLYGNNGNWSSLDILSKTITYLEDGENFRINLGSVNSTSLNGIVLVIISYDFEIGHWIRVGSNITVEANSVNTILDPSLSFEFDQNESTSVAYSFELASAVVGVSITSNVSIDLVFAGDQGLSDAVITLLIITGVSVVTVTIYMIGVRTNKLPSPKKIVEKFRKSS